VCRWNIFCFDCQCEYYALAYTTNVYTLPGQRLDKLTGVSNDGPGLQMTPSRSDPIASDEATAMPSAFALTTDHLPNELLSKIFLEGEFLYPTCDHHIRSNYLPFPLLVSSVSRRFRTIALSTQMLWSSIHVRPLSPKLTASAILWFQRSKTCLLDLFINIRFRRPLEKSEIIAVTELVLPHLHRCRRLIIDADRHVEFFVLTAPFPSMRHMRHIKLSIRQRGPWVTRATCIGRVSANDGALKFVRLDAVFSEPPFPLRGLIRLDLSEIHISCPELRDVLEASPSLQHLIFRCLRNTPFEVHEDITVSLPNLRFLAMDLSSNIGPHLLSILHTPNLHHLEISNMSESTFGDLITLFGDTQPYPVLRILALHASYLESHINPAFYSLFPTITHLLLCGTYGAHILTSLDVLLFDEGPALPHLNCIVGDLAPAWVREVLEAYSAIGQPLSAVYSSSVFWPSHGMYEEHIKFIQEQVGVLEIWDFLRMQGYFVFNGRDMPKSLVGWECPD
jgi:hypothetical protein